MQAWCPLLPQAEMTINMMRPSRLNPRLSTYAQLSGNFDYNKTPLAPPGTKVLVYETLACRQSWATHGIEGWYVGPAMEHYRDFRCYIPTTGSERIAETLDFFPKHAQVPSTSSQDAAISAANDLLYALKNLAPFSPTLQLGDEKLRALEKLAEIFNNNITSPSITTPK